MRLSVILPTYNERETVSRLIDRVARALDGIPHELVFVDDSTDGTDAEIVAGTRRYPQIVLVHRARRAGLATAVVEGIRRARGEVLCVLDADLQHPPEAIPLLLEALERARADLVVASRHLPGGADEGLGAARRLASRAATLLARGLLSRGRLVSDPMSGFFAVRREALAGVALRPVGYKILLEVLVRARLRRVVEVPYRFQARGAGASKLSARQQWEYALHLLRLLTVQPDDLRCLRFGLVGASGVLVNMGVLWSLAGRGLHYLLAGAAATAVATTWNFLLNDVFTWRDRRSSSLSTRAARYGRYWVVTAVSAAIQLGLLVGLTTAGVPYLLSNLVGIGTAAAWNFRTNGVWTWTPPRPSVVRLVHPGPPAGASAPAGVPGASGR
jgi:dolichol-phosphate mannosyltransferase